MDFGAVGGLALLFAVVLLIVLAVVALLAVQPRTWH
jgi:hypothetical protein